MQDLTVTLVQAATHWHAPEENLQFYGELLAPLGRTDLIVLPEMFTTGFTMAAADQAESMQGRGLEWLAEQSRQHDCVVTGSLVIEERGRYYNRLIWMCPDGSFAQYDKRHLFRMADEHHHYTAGDQRIVVTLNGWRICPLICYDLRFPVWSRNVSPSEVGPSVDGAGDKTGDDGTGSYDLLLYVANWPDPRRNAWNTLLEARAIENLAYTIGVNRVGKDGNGLGYAGDSCVIDFKGQRLVDCGAEQCSATTRLSARQLTEFREKFPACLDADSFSVEQDTDTGSTAVEHR